MISSNLGSVALDENAVIQKIFVSVFNSNENIFTIKNAKWGKELYDK